MTETSSMWPWSMQRGMGEEEADVEPDDEEAPALDDMVWVEVGET